MWKAWVISEVLKPLIRRAGTALSAYLVGNGVAADDTSAIVIGATTAIAVGIDLINSSVNRKAGK